MPGLPGRRAQAARNDTTILEAAREVFIADPKAPISAVAERAGVGISALYRRWAGKEDLLRQLCHDGLRQYIAEATAALDSADPLPQFLTAIVDADLHSLTLHLAGLFTPTPEMGADAIRSGELTTALLDRARAAKQVRDDVVVGDLNLVLEACAAVRLPGEPDRTRTLRRRLLAILLAGLSAGPDAPPLPGPPPTPDESNWRWRRT